jgi:hypothetical protein
MINYIRKILAFFIKPKKAKQKDFNSILFSLDKNHFTSIFVEINNLSDSAATGLGQLLYMINNGQAEKSILDVLLKIAKQDEESKNFVRKTLESCSEEYLTQDNLYKKLGPIVRPTDFNTIAKK